MMRRYRVKLASEDDVEGWRTAARALEQGGVRPEDVRWTIAGGERDLFQAAERAAEILIDASGADDPPAGAAAKRRLPKRFVERIDQALLHNDPSRFALAYRTFVRAARRPSIAGDPADPDVDALEKLAQSVARDMHKMKAFVRFRRVAAPDGAEAFVAWFEPDHHIVRAIAPFFQRRFAQMRWSILTPRACVHWTGAALAFGPGEDRSRAPADDALEDAWRAYYAAIFNPARLKPKAMTADMPKKYWKNLPEAELIQPLMRSARARAADMVAAAPTLAEGRIQKPYAPTFAPASGLDACRRCGLHAAATQAVPGEGPTPAALMFVGEQPGDQEDLAGRPFVGPAGGVFDAALKRVGLARGDAYVTNAVKHFKFEPRGKRRLHQRPDAGEIEACRWWLETERRLVRPKLIVAMGATAARAVWGRPVKVTAARGRVEELPDGAHGLITVHPSYLLRLTDREAKKREWNTFLADLRTAKAWLEAAG